jgi:hypothetical protein
MTVKPIISLGNFRRILLSKPNLLYGMSIEGITRYLMDDLGYSVEIHDISSMLEELCLLSYLVRDFSRSGYREMTPFQKSTTWYAEPFGLWAGMSGERGL